MTGKISAINNKIVPETVSSIKKIAIDAGYTPPTAPIEGCTNKIKEEALQISKEAAEAIKITHSPINIAEPKAIPDDVIKSYEASIGK